jgi:hypothetical protein
MGRPPLVTIFKEIEEGKLVAKIWYDAGPGHGPGCSVSEVV